MESIDDLQQLQQDARRYRWIRDNIKHRLTDASNKDSEFAEHKTQFELPLLISWADFCGSITLDEAIDIKTGHYE